MDPSDAKNMSPERFLLESFCPALGQLQSLFECIFNIITMPSSVRVPSGERGHAVPNLRRGDVSMVAFRISPSSLHSMLNPMEKRELRRLPSRNNATSKEEVSFVPSTDYCNAFLCDSSPQIEQASPRIEDEMNHHADAAILWPSDDKGLPERHH